MSDRKTRPPIAAAPPATPATARSAGRSAQAASAAAPPASRRRPAPAVPAPIASPEPLPKVKLVRDSFTIPKAEYLVLEQLKLRAARLGRPTKKSELIRAGIKALAALGEPALLEAIGRVPSLKTGRPQKTAPP